MNLANKIFTKNPNVIIKAIYPPNVALNLSNPINPVGIVLLDSPKTSAHIGWKTFNAPTIMSEPILIIRNPMIAFNVPDIILEISDFCNTRPNKTIMPIKNAGTPKILLAIHKKTFDILIPPSTEFLKSPTTIL